MSTEKHIENIKTSLNLFGNNDGPTIGAEISPCGAYRYHLWRIWDRGLPTMVFVMQNPSTADANSDDPTIRKCVGFARSHGYGSISVRNVFALRATDERELLKHSSPFGPCNTEHLLAVSGRWRETRLMLAWGNEFGGKRLRQYYREAESILLTQSPYCLGVTKSGSPKHPLFVPYSQEIVRFVKR
jgi:hypothetical protein